MPLRVTICIGSIELSDYFSDSTEEIEVGREGGARFRGLDVEFPETAVEVKSSHVGLRRLPSGGLAIGWLGGSVFLDGNSLAVGQVLPTVCELRLGSMVGPKLKLEVTDDLFVERRYNLSGSHYRSAKSALEPAQRIDDMLRLVKSVPAPSLMEEAIDELPRGTDVVPALADAVTYDAAPDIGASPRHLDQNTVTRIRDLLERLLTREEFSAHFEDLFERVGRRYRHLDEPRCSDRSSWHRVVERVKPWLVPMGFFAGGALAHWLLDSRFWDRVFGTATIGGARQIAGGRESRVEVAVFAPPECARGDSCRVQVFLHETSDRESVRSEALGFDPAAATRGRRTLRTQLVNDDIMEVHLLPVGGQEPAFHVLPLQSYSDRWVGEPLSIDFILTAKEEALCQVAAFAAVVTRNGTAVGELYFTIRIEQAVSVKSPPPLADATAKRYLNVFFSYAREDAEKVQLLARGYRAVEQGFYWDVDALGPGQEWEKELYQKIEKADLFMLFWSSSARDSAMVRKEVECALVSEAKQGRPRFFPFPIEGPPPPEPWEFIANRHIGDPLYYRVAWDVERQTLRSQVEGFTAARQR